ncbi:letm1 and EF-hand domain-containing protein 1, mitochondrial [Sparganum proliferum]
MVLPRTRGLISEAQYGTFVQTEGQEPSAGPIVQSTKIFLEVGLIGNILDDFPDVYVIRKHGTTTVQPIYTIIDEQEKEGQSEHRDLWDSTLYESNCYAQRLSCDWGSKDIRIVGASGRHIGYEFRSICVFSASACTPFVHEVPFMELLLPFYLKFFPFMLPSTFKDRDKEDEKRRRALQAKLTMAKFLQDTVMNTTAASAKGKDMPTIMEFQEFMKLVRQSGQLANTTDIMRFSRLFEDQVTLDSLQYNQLKALCQLLEIPAFGPSNLLRFQLWLRVRQLRAEDRLLAKEDVAQLPVWELQNLSRDRGMRSLGLTEERLRSQLSQWLELHLEKNVPISLLLLSRAMYVQDTTLPPEQQLQHVISVLPVSASEEAAIKAVESTEGVDPKTKIEVLRKEQESIKAERAAEKQRQSDEKKKLELAKQTEEEKMELAKKAEIMAKTADKTDILVGKAETLKPTPGETLVDIAKPLTDGEPVAVQSVAAGTSVFAKPATAATVGPKIPDVAAQPPSVSPLVLEPEEHVISSKDLDSIASAIGNIAESNKAMKEEELKDLKADIEETAKRRQELQVEAITSTEELPTAAVSVAGDVAATEITKPDEEPESKAKKAAKAKAEKAVKRISAQVDRLIEEMGALMDQLEREKTDLLKDIQIREDKAKEATKDEEKERIFDSIRADQQRVVDITDVFSSLQQIKQQEPDLERCQQILDALDEDHDGKIELKHLRAVLKLMGREGVALNTKQMADVVEMLEQEEMVQESTKDAAAAAAQTVVPAADGSKPTSPTTNVPKS